jgi:hypothetical protein
LPGLLATLRCLARPGRTGLAPCLWLPHGSSLSRPQWLRERRAPWSTRSRRGASRRPAAATLRAPAPPHLLARRAQVEPDAPDQPVCAGEEPVVPPRRARRSRAAWPAAHRWRPRSVPPARRCARRTARLLAGQVLTFNDHAECRPHFFRPAEPPERRDSVRGEAAPAWVPPPDRGRGLRDRPTTERRSCRCRRPSTPPRRRSRRLPEERSRR